MQIAEAKELKIDNIINNGDRCVVNGTMVFADSVIGWLTNFMSLSTTLILPLAFMAITALRANRVMLSRTGAGADL